MYSEVVAALAATASRLEKERILSTMKGNTHFQSLLKWTFDSFKMFGINKIPKPESYGSGTIQEQWKHIEPVLQKLVSRELSGGRAQFAVAEMLSSLTEAEAEVMTNVLRKDLRCGVSSKTVNKVFPKLIPEFELMLAAQEKSSKVQEHSYIEPKLDGCLSGDWVVRTEDGPMRIRDVVDSKYSGGVESFNHKTNEVEFNNISSWSKRKTGKSWYILSLSDGTKTKPITGNHLVWVDNKSKYIRVDELVEGDSVLMVK